MITQVLHCPSGHGSDLVRHGTTPEGQQRYRSRACPERGRTLLLEDTSAGQSPAVKQQSVEMAMHASGLRDTARVLHGSPTTGMKALQKRHRSCSKCIRWSCSLSIQSTWRSRSAASTSWPSAAA
jgi:transposase